VRRLYCILSAEEHFISRNKTREKPIDIKREAELSFDRCECTLAAESDFARVSSGNAKTDRQTDRARERLGWRAETHFANLRAVLLLTSVEDESRLSVAELFYL